MLKKNTFSIALNSYGSGYEIDSSNWMDENREGGRMVKTVLLALLSVSSGKQGRGNMNRSNLCRDTSLPVSNLEYQEAVMVSVDS